MKHPRYEYSRGVIEDRISYLQKLQAPFGLVVRYAVKANPYPAIIKIMNEQGVYFDASSSYEAAELLAEGVVGSHISLSSQQSAHNLDELLQAGVQYVATSRNQLVQFLSSPNHPASVGVRINPDVGYGHNNRTSTGGVNASFGVWHEYGFDLQKQADKAGVVIDRMHIHVGSGADPSVWGEVMDRALVITEQFKDVLALDIGGGFKVHRYGEEKETDMEKVFAVFQQKLRAFQAKTGREIQLEIEPGTFFIAHAGTLVAYVDDIVDTGKDGYTFLRLNTGMNDFLRSSLYGARHNIEVMTTKTTTQAYVVVGHNCESGDIFTPTLGNPEEIETVILKQAEIGDEVRISDVGAYSASMRAKGYNSFPEAIEVMVE